MGQFEQEAFGDRFCAAKSGAAHVSDGARAADPGGFTQESGYPILALEVADGAVSCRRPHMRGGSKHDAVMGPKTPRSTVLSAEEEAMVIAFRKHTLLALDDCLYALQASVPHLTRSSLHRCFQRHGISRLPAIAGEWKAGTRS